MRQLSQQEQRNPVVWLLLGSPEVVCVILHCAEWDYSLAVSWLPQSLHLTQVIQEKKVQFRLELSTEETQSPRNNSQELKDFSSKCNRFIYLFKVQSIEQGLLNSDHGFIQDKKYNNHNGHIYYYNNQDSKLFA